MVISGDLVRAKARGEQLCGRIKSAELLLLMAIVNWRLGEPDAAMKYAQQSIKVDRTVADTHFFLATVLRAKNEIDSAIRHVKRGLELDPGSAEGYNKLGAFLSMQNKNEAAEKAFRQAIDKDPNHGAAYYNLGDLRHQKTDLAAAEKLFARAVQLTPGFAEAHNELGSVLLKQGKLEEALEALGRAISIKSDFTEAYSSKGQALEILGRHDEALACLRQAVSIEPASLGARKVLASILLESGGSELDEAIAEFEKILEIAPNDVAALTGLAHAYLYLGQEDSCMEYTQQILDRYSASEVAMAGVASIYDRLSRFDDAYDCLRPQIEKGIATVSVALLFASICRHVSRCESAIEQVEKLLTNHALVPNEKRQLYFSVAQLYDRQGDYDKAFKFYEKANNLNFRPYDPGKDPKKINALLEVYTEEFLKAAPHSDYTSEQMIFIVGMPRSGTSLLEQVLDSHSQVYGAGELVYITKMLKKLHEGRGDEKSGYPYCITDIKAGALNEMAGKYLASLPPDARHFPHVTDKLPNNFLHLGFIEMLFPNARIIHCQRDPLDTCLSCYFQDFSGHLNYAYNLEHLGLYYRQYRKLMEHWKRVLNIPVLDIQYENMVADTEQNIRSILEFCGLPWEDACLDFHKSARVVKTASYDQVRRPVYKGSVGRWKNYSKNIAPLKKALGME